MMLGSPGSGKSYVADWLTPHLKAVKLKSDELRIAMYGFNISESHDREHNEIIFAAMQYAADQVLSRGHSVIYDTNSNKLAQRKSISKLAEAHGAIGIVLWVNTPNEIAKQRAIDRDKHENPSADVSYIDHMAAEIEEPEASELVIKIDGTQSASEQQKIFNQQLRGLAI